MNKLLKRFVCILISFIVVLGCAGCDCRGDKTEELISKHSVKMEKTDRFLVKDGVTEYQIVFDKTKDGELYKFAVEELQYFFKEATGIELTAISDEGLTYTNSSKYISLGETTLLHESGISVEHSKFKNSGFRMLTKKGVLYIAGSRSNLRAGTFYGAQEFLKYTVDFKAYAVDEIHYEKKSICRNLSPIDGAYGLPYCLHSCSR